MTPRGAGTFHLCFGEVPVPIHILNRRTWDPTYSVPDPVAYRPNDGSSFWPDFSNTGHTNAPSYTGSVTDYTTGMTQSGWIPVQAPDATTFTGKRFLGKTGIGYDGGGDNFVFEGCLFEGVQPNDNLVQLYSPTNVTFRYCTFKPAPLSTPPGNDGTVSSSHTAPGTPYDQSWQYVANMVAGMVAKFEYCDVWGNAGLQCTGGRDEQTPGTFYRCYIHDQADTDSSGAPPGQEYHHDGIGPDSEGGSHDTLIQECTIASRGNTNGIALQGLSTYNRITVRDCYLSGWGYAVSIGATTPWAGTNITMSGNVFSAELPIVFGPLYGNLWNSGGGTNVWENNRYQVRPGDMASAWTTADNGRFWWPTDNSSHADDYAG